MNFEDLEKNVISWAEARDIFEQSTITTQCAKLDEEFRELCQAILDGDRVNIIDSIGDMMVVQTILAHFCKTSMTACYEYAWNQIKDRKGKLVNGLFVKEA